MKDWSLFHLSCHLADLEFTQHKQITSLSASILYIAYIPTVIMTPRVEPFQMYAKNLCVNPFVLRISCCNRLCYFVLFPILWSRPSHPTLSMWFCWMRVRESWILFIIGLVELRAAVLALENTREKCSAPRKTKREEPDTQRYAEVTEV